MFWIGVAGLAFTAWLSVGLFLLALCRVAGHADARMNDPTDAGVIELRAFGRPRARAGTGPGSPVARLTRS